MIKIKKTLLLIALAWPLHACHEATDADAGRAVRVVNIDYSLASGSLAKAVGNDAAEEFPDKTVFCFVGFSGDLIEPSLTEHFDVPDYASPYGFYAYKKESDKVVSFIPCNYNSSTWEYTHDDPKKGQKLTANKDQESSATYQIMAFTPPRPVDTYDGGAVIPYKRGEDLYMAEKLFSITIPGRANNVYQVYQVPQSFTFRNMKSELKIAFYEKDVKFSLKGKVMFHHLGTRAYVKPYDKKIGLFYNNDDSPLGNLDHLQDEFTLTTVNSTDNKGTLRYSLPAIPIFPADYSAETLVYPLELEIAINYDGQSESEQMKIRIPINAIASRTYLISFIVSRTSVTLTQHDITSGSEWETTLPDNPLEVGGAAGGVLLGSWDVEWPSVSLPGDEL